MQLVTALVSGIRGAENGTVEFLQRGTSSGAIYYTDFEASTARTPGAPVALGTNGELVAYVHGLTNCIVRDSGGNIVRTFVAGEAAASVEVISQSFTGVDYSSGASGASEPVPIETILDLWKTNAGTTDWKVLVNGVARTLQSAMSAISGLFFSVKDPLYGALGDNATDDSSKIQACLNACSAAGGGIVFFPAGSYVCTAAGLSIPAGVSLMGPGAGTSKIYLNHATADLLTFAASTASWQSVSGLSLLTKVAAAGALLTSISALRLVVQSCIVGDANTNYAALFGASTDQYVRFTDCTLTNGVAGNSVVMNLGELVVERCALIPTATQNNPMIWVVNGKRATISKCAFLNSTATAGVFPCVWLDGTAGNYSITDCDFANGGGATVTAIKSLKNDQIYEHGNNFGTTLFAAYSFPGAVGGTTREGLSLLSRDTRQVAYASDANITAACDQYGHINVTRAAGFANVTTLTLNQPFAPGQRATIVYRNSNGGGATGLVTVTTVKGLANFTVNASSVSSHFLESEESGGALRWVLVSSQVNYAP